MSGTSANKSAKAAKAETPLKPKTTGLLESGSAEPKANTTLGPKQKRRHEEKSSLKSQIGYRVDIVSNSYDDILFYEKKALQLEGLTDKFLANTFRIDMQMNLAEFLHKIKPAIIKESDLASESFSEKVIHESKKAGMVKSLNKTVKVIDE